MMSNATNTEYDLSLPNFKKTNPPAARQGADSGVSRPATGKKRSTAAARKRKKRRARRLMLFSVLFLLFAILVLTAVIVGVSCSCKGSACPLPFSDEHPTASPEPVSDSTVLNTDATVQGVSVKGMTVAEARTAVQSAMEQTIASVAITVQYDQHSLVLTADKMGITYDIDSVLYGIANNRTRGEHSVPLHYEEAIILDTLYSLNEQIPNHAVNARAEIQYETYQIEGMTYHRPYFVYTDGVNGMLFDYDTILTEIRSALDSGNYTAVITPSVTVSEPAVTTDSLKERTTLLASYSTTYRFKKTSSMTVDEIENAQARDRNISKAISMMQCIRLRPGEMFSFNNATGKRSEDNGWAMAKAVYQGSYRKETGGGVCQITTTMFNALLRANVNIVSRRGHSIPSDYVTAHFEDGLGFDATVDYGNIDFKFSNTFDSDIYIFCYITENASSGRKKDIHIEVYGKAAEPGVEYRCRNEIVEMLDFNDALPEYIYDDHMSVTADPIIEREGHNYYKVTTYIDKYINGVFMETVRTETTEYDLILPKIRVGTQTVQPPVYTDPEPFEPENTDDGGGNAFIPNE